MSGIQVKKEEQPARATPNYEWDPARMMRQFFGWDPFKEMAPLARGESTFSPAFEVKESKEGYVFKADVPGVKESDVEITVTGNRLTISGKREAEKQERTDTYYTFERSFGSFARSFTMPPDADLSGTHAELKDGVLTLQVQRRPDLQPKKVPIRTPNAK